MPWTHTTRIAWQHLSVTRDPVASTSDRPVPRGRRRYGRDEGLEFDRLAFFTDAVFAIAMTLLVVAIDPPEILRDVAAPRTLWSALAELYPQIFSFFLAFLLLGRYWMANHAFVASLKSMDRTIMAATLTYLAFVAFLPFPTALVGEYEVNPVSVVMFASTLAFVSGMEAVLFSIAVRRGHTRTPFSPRSYRYGLIQSLTPVLLFAISIPIAFWNTTVALLTWLLGIPIGFVVARLRPADARAYMKAMGFAED